MFVAIAISLVANFSSIRVSASDFKPTLQITAPETSSVEKGVITLIFKVNGLLENQYEPFWAVGDDQWNRMSTSNGVSTTQIDTTNWNWNADGKYVLSFIALKKENWQPIIQKKTVTIDRQAMKDGLIDSTFTIPTRSPGAPIAQPIPNTDVLKSLFVDPSSDAQMKAKAWIADHPQDSDVMNKLVSQPLVNWYGGWNKDVYKDVDSYVTSAANAGQVPVLAAYNIPHRDCGSYSAGGLRDKQAYLNWISQIANAIRDRDAMVLLEPDALAGMDCLSKQAQAERTEMLRSSISMLKSRTGAKVYIDAGHPKWHDTGEMASRLSQAGIDEADGFSLNVSNFTSTEMNVAYGTELSRKTKNAHFVIDTSRNGNGPTANLEWCNPSGIKTGNRPTLSTGEDLVDAYLWVKAPGGSDGTCGAQQLGTSAPSAGQWWPQYALNILR